MGSDDEGEVVVLIEDIKVVDVLNVSRDESNDN